MNSQSPNPPSFWRTVRLLLAAARRRSAGRQERQRELLRHRSGRDAPDWGKLGFAFGVVFMAVINIVAAFGVRSAVAAGVRKESDRRGQIVVSKSFLEEANRAAANAQRAGTTAEEQLASFYYSSEAKDIVKEYGGTQEEIEQKLRVAMRNHGTRDFILDEDSSSALSALAGAGGFPAMLGSVTLLWWGVMLVFQGEGLESDLQRRRHPMWEWLLSHPVPFGAVFLAEMLSPIAANPIFWGAPLFAGFLYGFIYGPGLGMVAVLLVGIPITIATACLGKALEIGVMIRFSPRKRGAIIGLMGWMGYSAMMLIFLGIYVMPKIITAIGKFLGPFAVLPWPWLRLFLGGQADGSFSFLSGMLTCWIVAAATVAAAVWFSVWGTQKGLSGNLGRTDTGPSASKRNRIRFGKEPLYRKEFLWFIRDRSAIIQTILIPLTVASFQLFNFRGFVSDVQGAWNYLSGAAILLGTYFLWILGPKSLTSEGTALWIALTWPRGLENLLKAKAWLWSLISTGIVALVLCYAAFLFPANIGQIVLVGIGWFFFSRSMAEKSVTLVTVPSSSGEAEKIPWSRRWAAQLGMLTFAIGVLTQRWHIAVMGIVYSYLTAAAMWENFRARLPYLYDVWSEKLPPPPTLMHAMVSISILVESGAVLTGFLLLFTGPEGAALAQAMAYAISAALVSVGVTSFLGGRGVSLSDVWNWPATATEAAAAPSWWRGDGWLKHQLLRLLPAGVAGGLLLGVFALGYIELLRYIPASAEMIRKSQELLARMPDWRTSYAVMAVGFAPFAEEYLFRGLLYRALDREWGGWRAVIGSAAFFAIYHPPLSWLPVGLLGIATALVFRKSGKLWPAVVLHMVYNAVVVLR